MSHSTPRILISGFGLITPLGNSAWETFRALLSGKTIASRTDNLFDNTSAVDLVRATGSVSIARQTLVDPAIALAEHAAREALTMANVPIGERLPCIIGTSKGAVHALTEAANQGVRDPGAARLATLGVAIHPTARSSGELQATGLGAHEVLTHALQKRLPLADTTHVVAACASSLVALHRARQTMLSEMSPYFDEDHDDRSPRRMLVITADAALLPMFIHAYRRLGVLPKLTPAEYVGRPLDQRRDGFMLSEAGAAVVLERVDANASVPRGAIELLDTAEACDAHDLIRPNAAMPALQFVSRKVMGQRAIDLIHAHAPGTREQDKSEMAVYRRLATHPTNDSAFDVYACKGAIGHSLGAAGLSSLVIACLCAKAKRRPPMPWLDEPIAGVSPQQTAAPIGAQAVFAAGFGGHVAGAAITCT